MVIMTSRYVPRKALISVRNPPGSPLSVGVLRACAVRPVLFKTIRLHDVGHVECCNDFALEFKVL